MDEGEQKNTGAERWKPGVEKNVLLVVAGIVWLGVGVILDNMSYSWLQKEEPNTALMAGAIGLIAAFIIHHFGTLRLVNKNLKRIFCMEGKHCVFAFISWKSYILIAVMVTTGFLLRRSPLPKIYLAPLYAGIGTALILSSFRYLRNFVSGANKK